MTILVTRPAPANAVTAEALRLRGYDTLLAPVLRYETVAFADDAGAGAEGVILTSANAVRAIAEHPIIRALAALPVYAVGEQTAETARGAGFADVTAAEGDAVSLRELILGLVRKNRLKADARLVYLSGVDQASDLASELGPHGLRVETVNVYRMIKLPAFPAAVRDALAAGEVQAVMHYSRRSAVAFVEAARVEGVEISALSLPQCCISENVAMVVRDAGAHRVAVARTPDEEAMILALERVLPGDRR